VTENKYLRLTAFFLLLVICITPAAADTKIRPTVAVDYQIEPTAFLPGDNGIITVFLKNMATGGTYVQEDNKTLDMDTYILSATLSGNNDIEVTSDSYTDIGLLGPSDTIELTFNVKARQNSSNGMNFLNFKLVGGSNMYDLNYKIPVKVDNTDLEITTTNLPSTMTNEVSNVTVDVVNTRQNNISNVIITPHGDNLTFTPKKFFIGTMLAGNMSIAMFTLNTMGLEQGVKTIKFEVSYFNGDNLHFSNKGSTNINVIKRSALLLTAIEVKNVGNTYTITGDINNMGTTDAKSVMISIIGSDGIEKVQPNPNYFIGTLGSDDFSSFELSARITSDNIKEIPVLIEFRGADNTYTMIKDSIDLGQVKVNDPGDGNSMSPITMAVVVFVVIGITGIIGYSWKNRRTKSVEIEQKIGASHVESDR
jgi:hypothetical protein